VSFHYKNDKTNRPEFGLIAEDVAKVNPDLVVRDENGDIYTVRYDAVNAMLLNEFLKEHRAFVEEQRKLEDQQKEIDSLKAELKEQKSLIQKVSDKIEVRQATTRVAGREP
jgi:DNA-directed RNA polymerase specialized sigma54-like protein